MKTCSICEKHKILKDFVIFETEDLVVAHGPTSAEQPEVYAGYFFIEPKNHITHLHQLSDRQAELIGLWSKRLSQVHKDFFDVDQTYYFKFADITPHLHVHVYPRHKNTPSDILGESVRFWSEAPKFNREEVLKFCEAVRRKA